MEFYPIESEWTTGVKGYSVKIVDNDVVIVLDVTSKDAQTRIINAFKRNVSAVSTM